MINLAATLQPIRRRIGQRLVIDRDADPKRAPWMKPFGGVR
jgi:hypothetical protein